MPYEELYTLLQKKSPQIAKMKDISDFFNNIAGYDITTIKGRENAMYYTCNIALIKLKDNTRLPDTPMADLLDHFWLELMMDLRGAIMTASYDPKGGIAAWKFCLLRLNSILQTEDHMLRQEAMEKHLGIRWEE